MKKQYDFCVWFCMFCRQQYFYKDIKKHFQTINHHNNKVIWQDTLLSHPLVKNNRICFLRVRNKVRTIQQS